MDAFLGSAVRNNNQRNGHASSRSRSSGKEDMMSIPKVQAPGDQQLLDLMQFICSRLEQVSRGVELQSIVKDAAKHREEGFEKTDDWYDGYLAAVKDIVVFIQCLQPSAAA